MKAGKLPPDLLSRLLARLPDDPKLLLGPGIGRDAAAIDLGNGRVLVAKADPVTFATEEIGRYVVHVNANDVACLGARPAWFLATVLLPERAGPELAEQIFEQIRSACEELGVIPVGGHTEVTLGLERPMIAGAMLGETTVETLVRPDGARSGDHLLLTKGIALEGTALLAREAPDELRARGLPESVIEASARLLLEPGISVVREALAACGTGHVHALHDPTEGGLATALLELAQAAGLHVRLRRDQVPILAETARVCDTLGLDPLGLLASGTLLIAIAPDACDATCAAVRDEGLAATCIGELVSGGGDVIIDTQEPLPRFERDELARFLETLRVDRG
ncbi:MAG: AIR synthase family protein [Chloroflexi bacterium]|nr:AIR synthase family protein [Chloroflexota bacterium]